MHDKCNARQVASLLTGLVIQYICWQSMSDTALGGNRMRIVSMVTTLCVLVLLLGAAGCAKKAQQPDGPAKPVIQKFSGTCAVCSKQSSNLIEFMVPHGSKIKVCEPSQSPTCVAKASAHPEKFGGSSSGGAAAAKAPGGTSNAAPPAGLGGAARGDSGRSSAGAPPGAASGTAPPPPAGGKIITPPTSGN